MSDDTILGFVIIGAFVIIVVVDRIIDYKLDKEKLKK